MSSSNTPREGGLLLSATAADGRKNNNKNNKNRFFPFQCTGPSCVPDDIATTNYNTNHFPSLNGQESYSNSSNEYDSDDNAYNNYDADHDNNINIDNANTKTTHDDDDINSIENTIYPAFEINVQKRNEIVANSDFVLRSLSSISQIAMLNGKHNTIIPGSGICGTNFPATVSSTAGGMCGGMLVSSSQQKQQQQPRRHSLTSIQIDASSKDDIDIPPAPLTSLWKLCEHENDEDRLVVPLASKNHNQNQTQQQQLHQQQIYHRKLSSNIVITPRTVGFRQKTTLFNYNIEPEEEILFEKNSASGDENCIPGYNNNDNNNDDERVTRIHVDTTSEYNTNGYRPGTPMSGNSRSPFHQIVRALTPKRYKNHHNHHNHHNNSHYDFNHSMIDDQTINTSSSENNNDKNNSRNNNNRNSTNGIAYIIPDLGTLDEEGNSSNNNDYDNVQTTSFVQLQPRETNRSSKWYKNSSYGSKRVTSSSRGSRSGNIQQYDKQNQSMSSCTTKQRGNTNSGASCGGTTGISNNNNKLCVDICTIGRTTGTNSDHHINKNSINKGSNKKLQCRLSMGNILVALFVFAEFIVLLTIGTSYLGTILALQSRNIIAIDATTKNIGITTMNETTPTTTAIANSNSSSTSILCNDNEFLLQFQIKFDTNPNEVGIVLNNIKHSSSSSIEKNNDTTTTTSTSSLWNFIPGYSFNSTEQIGTTNTFSICLKLTSSYILNITDLGCNGLVSSSIPTTINNNSISSSNNQDNDGSYWQIQSNGIPLIQYNDQCTDPNKSTTIGGTTRMNGSNTTSENITSSSDSDSIIINECGFYSTCLYKISNQTFIGRCTTMSCTNNKKKGF